MPEEHEPQASPAHSPTHRPVEPEPGFEGGNAPETTSTRPPATAGGPSEFHPLDPRVINLWRLQQTISSFILLSLALLVGTVIALANPPLQLWILGGWVALAFLRLFLLIWYPRRAFVARGYRIDGRVLETQRGIWFKVITLLPLSRLQHVDLNRGPLERMFGLASLVLYTAGTQHAMVIIPGLDEAEAQRLRDHLVAVGGDDAV